MPRVEHDLYVEQDDKTTRLMLHADGDPPVCLAEYDRALAETASSVSFMKIATTLPPATHCVGVVVHMTSGPLDPFKPLV